MSATRAVGVLAAPCTLLSSRCRSVVPEHAWRAATGIVSHGILSRGTNNHILQLLQLARSCGQVVVVVVGMIGRSGRGVVRLVGSLAGWRRCLGVRLLVLVLHIQAEAPAAGPGPPSKQTHPLQRRPRRPAAAPHSKKSERP